MELKYLKIGGLCDVSSSRRVFAKQYVEDGIPFYRQKEIIDKKNGDKIDEPIFISELVYNEFKEKSGVPIMGDLLITSVGTLGIPYVVGNEKFYFKDGNLIWLNNFRDELNSEFLYYWIDSSFGTQTLWNRTIGSAQPALTIDSIKKLSIPIPSRHIQDKIVTALKIYDATIKNNNRRITILEQMAENLYKEWFVRFRFPGYEDNEFEHGIPKDWEYKRLGEELDIKRGGSPRPIQEYLSDTGYRWLKISDATSAKNPFVFEIKEKIKEEGLKKTVFLKEGSLVLSNSATPGLPKILAVDSCIHDGWLYFQNQKLSNEFLYLLFIFIRNDLVSRGNGAVFTNLKTEILKKYMFLKPSIKVIEKFDAIIKPIFWEIYMLSKSNINLIKQRDLLLPRLMSGKLEVK